MRETLRNYISNIREGNGAAHAYIVDGRSKDERDSFVKQFTKALLCVTPLEGYEACGICPSCIQVEAGTSMDVIHMEMGGKSGYLADDASAFMGRLNMGAYGSHLIGIIDEGDKLSEIVQNKLLKTLEEPAEGAIIIISTANSDNLLSTVRSRCILIRLCENDRSEGSVDADKFSNKLFFQYRDALDKDIKSSDDALALLGKLEDRRRDAMLKGGRNASSHADAIELIENARRDIQRGMNYSKALKRLYLELCK